jgi:2'-hydroxyisoflavone reductase
MRVLVLGGTHYVGRSLVEAALARGDDVSVLNRGRSAAPLAGVAALIADRTDPQALRRALGDHTWDAVVDTWHGPPRAVADACAVLAGRVAHYGYVSSWAVYRKPLPCGADERAAVVDGDPDDDVAEEYPTAKSGSERAVRRTFGDRALITRPGPMFGPHEDVGTLTWWLRRIAAGGQVLAPGAPTDALQYIDTRDHSTWLLDAAQRRLGGTFNTVCPPGHATIGDLLEQIRSVTGSDAELVWVPDDVLVAEGVRPYLDIPLWLPPNLRGGYNHVYASAAHRAGLGTSRPLRQTLLDTWHWLQRDGEPPWRDEYPERGLDRAAERRLIGLVTQV